MSSVQTKSDLYKQIRDITLAKHAVQVYVDKTKRVEVRQVQGLWKRPGLVEPGTYRLIAHYDGKYEELFYGLEACELAEALTLISDEVGQCAGLHYIGWPESLPMPFELS